jgi:hypothetical protein
MKDKLIISFSGGETSAYMTQYLLLNYSDVYDMVVVFANTSQENESTLDFIEQCDKYFNMNVVWVESVFNPINGKGVTARVVDYKTASRNGEPFEAMIAKHGIPNASTPHCSRDLKRSAILDYAKQLGWKKYFTAIGIRADEVGRVSSSAKKNKVIYPLIDIGFTKLKVNSYWDKMPFRLALKGYEGNCKVCWKKSLRKLMTIAVENPSAFDFFERMEQKYGAYIPESRLHNAKIQTPIRFFRGNMTVQDIKEASKNYFEHATDDSRNTIEFQKQVLQLDLFGGCIESCEVY